MFPYIVVIAPRSVHQFNYRDREIPQREWQAGLPEEYPTHPAQLDIERPIGMQAHFMLSENNAKAHAAWLARLHPEHEVYICQTIGMTISKPPVPTIMSVTEKGILPE